MPDVDPIFEDTLNKEYGFLDDDLEKQVTHINQLFQMKATKVDELEKKQSQILAANEQQKKEISHLLKLMDDQRKQIELLQKTEIKACKEIKEVSAKMQQMTCFHFVATDESLFGEISKLFALSASVVEAHDVEPQFEGLSNRINEKNEEISKKQTQIEYLIELMQNPKKEKKEEPWTNSLKEVMNFDRNYKSMPIGRAQTGIKIPSVVDISPSKNA